MTCSVLYSTSAASAASLVWWCLPTVFTFPLAPALVPSRSTLKAPFSSSSTLSYSLAVRFWPIATTSWIVPCSTVSGTNVALTPDESTLWCWGAPRRSSMSPSSTCMIWDSSWWYRRFGWSTLSLTWWICSEVIYNMSKIAHTYLLFLLLIKYVGIGGKNVINSNIWMYVISCARLLVICVSTNRCTNQKYQNKTYNFFSTRVSLVTQVLCWHYHFNNCHLQSIRRTFTGNFGKIDMHLTAIKKWRFSFWLQCKK